MDKRVVLLISIALITGIAIPLVTDILTTRYSREPLTTIPTTTPTQSPPYQPSPSPSLIPIPTPHTPIYIPISPRPSDISIGDMGLGNYRELWGLLSRTFTRNKLTLSIARELGLYTPWILPLSIRESGAVETLRGAIEPGDERVSLTNIQVEGVDEPDLAKTNGVLIVVSRDRYVYVVNAAYRNMSSRLEFSEPVYGLFLYGNILVVLTETVVLENPVVVEGDLLFHRPGVESVLYIVDLSNPVDPVIRANISISGRILSSRLMKDIVYVVAYTEALSDDRFYVPFLNRVIVDAARIYPVDDFVEYYTTILSINITSLEYNVITLLTPRGSRIYMSHSRLYLLCTHSPEFIIQPLLVFLNISIDVIEDKSLAVSIREHVERGEFDVAYRALREYLVKSRNRESILLKISTILESMYFTDLTSIYVFNVNGLKVEYGGVVRVGGEVLDQFAVEEYDGYLVVATTETTYTYRLLYWPRRDLIEVLPVVNVVTCEDGVCKTITMPVVTETPRGVGEVVDIWIYPYIVRSDWVNNVYTISLEKLEVRGVLEGLAPGERVFAARLVKNIFFLVTFRLVDPLFAIDVSNPESPVVVGYLKIPGFSEYLHPLPGDLLLGVGLEENGLKISLFDVGNPVNMSEVSKVYLESAWSPVLVDHHAFTIDLDKKLVYIPISIHSGQWGPGEVGVLVTSFDNRELDVVKILDHSGAQRSIYIGKELYTISPYSIKIWNTDTWEQVAEIDLP